MRLVCLLVLFHTQHIFEATMDYIAIKDKRLRIFASLYYKLTTNIFRVCAKNGLTFVNLPPSFPFQMLPTLNTTHSSNIIYSYFLKFCEDR